MKTLTFGLILLVFSTAAMAAPPEVNEKVLKAFNETFKDAVNVNWNELDNYVEACFNQNEIQTRARYDNDGNLLGTIRYYSEKQLPLHIVVKLKAKYPKRAVFGVTEIFTGDEIQYQIAMQDAKHWYTVISNSIGNLEQIDRFNKSE